MLTPGAAHSPSEHQGMSRFSPLFNGHLAGETLTGLEQMGGELNWLQVNHRKPMNPQRNRYKPYKTAVNHRKPPGYKHVTNPERNFLARRGQETVLKNGVVCLACIVYYWQDAPAPLACKMCLMAMDVGKVRRGCGAVSTCGGSRWRMVNPMFI